MGCLSDLIHTLEMGAPHSWEPRVCGLSAKNLSFPCGPVHTPTCASSQHGDWVFKGSVIRP